MIEKQNLEQELSSKKSQQDSDRKNDETIPAHANPNIRTKFTHKVEITQ